MLVASRVSGLPRPYLTLAVLGATNAGFWLSYGIYQLRLHWAPSPYIADFGAYALAIVGWFLVFLFCTVYELWVFLRGLWTPATRKVSIAGLACVAVQIYWTLGLLIAWIEGA